MDAYTRHLFPGTVLTDLNGDRLPELIVTADRSTPDKGNHNSSIFWNRSGAFREQDKTVLPMPAPFSETHIDLDAASIDADGDGLLDLIVVGTQGNPFYDGWFVQLLMNQGDGTGELLDTDDLESLHQLLLFPGQRTQHGLQLGNSARWIDCQ